MKTKSKIPTEAYEQQQIIKWWALKSKGLKLFENSLFHIPNGTQAACRMKKRGLGVRSGVPDLYLALPSGGYHGLWIELKRTKGGEISEEQIDFISFLKSMHYAAFVCKGHAKAQKLITTYLTKPEDLLPMAGKIIYE